MHRLTTALLILVFAAATFACDKQQDAASSAAPEPAETAELAGDDKGAAAEAAATVEVAVDGTNFEPPVDPATLPAGAWYCDMGTTHYAAMEKGEDKCPICGMALTLKE